MIWNNPERIKWLSNLKEGDYVQILAPFIPDFKPPKEREKPFERATTLSTECSVIESDNDWTYVDYDNYYRFSKQTGLRDDNYSAIFP